MKEHDKLVGEKEKDLGKVEKSLTDTKVALVHDRWAPYLCSKYHGWYGIYTEGDKGNLAKIIRRLGEDEREAKDNRPWEFSLHEKYM